MSGVTVTNPPSVDAEAPQDPRKRLRLKALPGGPMLWVLIVVVILAIVITQGVFIRPSNITTVLFQSAVIGVLALAQGFAVLAKGLDLSVGATAVLAAIVAGGMSSDSVTFLPTVPLPLALLAAIGVGVLVGLLNGVLAGYTPVPPFIITLSTFLLVGGVTYLLTNATPVTQPDPFFRALGDAQLFIVPVPVLVWVVFIVLAAVILNRTTLGTKVYAIGGNDSASRLSGVAVPRVKVMVYVIAGVLAAIAGIMFLSRTGTVLPSDGGNFMLDSIAAVAVGGLSLMGGVGRVRDVVIGVLLLAIVGNVMNLLGISQYLQQSVQGFIILLAVGVSFRLSGSRSGHA
ncbi:ABC transporter permease [Microbacterium sp. Marseille-Q6648]|uniref:ABC transporter permease n=1 Tax=Microbacterium sp. Marseille-Q6648 TaxID=2937991 RepID=UPI00203F9CB3|nr:ABC transporter permease [Microbacterium sp. Marseille-Q6648]